jgi:aerobic C4-dicarboxylate transport protein
VASGKLPPALQRDVDLDQRPAPDLASEAKWLADGFIQLVKTVTGPVVFLTVVVGISALGDMARAGGLAVRALGYFFAMTIVALALGLLAGNIFKPGAGFTGAPSESGQEAAKERIAEAGEASGETGGLPGFLLDHLLPSSFVEPFVENEILRILVIAILTAAAISVLPTVQRERVVGVLEVASKIIFGIIRLIMWAAPIGAFGGMAFTVAQFGGGALTNLLKLMAVFWGTAAFFVFVLLGAIALWSGFNIFKFIRLLKDELLIILGTSSSETVLPRLLAKLERAGASREVVGVTIPTGYSFNLDGTCIYLTLAALFIVQAGGQELPLGTQIALAGLMVLTSKGAAGITGAGLVTLVASLQAFGGQVFSAESLAIGISLVVGIDRVMSEGRALTNMIGNAVATMVIAKAAGRARRRAFPGRARRPRDRRSAVRRPGPRRGGRGGGTPRAGARAGVATKASRAGAEQVDIGFAPMAVVRSRASKAARGRNSDHATEGATVAELVHELERAHPAVGG